MSRLVVQVVALCVFWASATMALGAQVFVIELDAAITPAAADYAARGFRKAVDAKAELIVLKLDTPGGLDKSMRTTIKAILASPVPVATFVAPEGARAASAGTYILYASHFAAMAPATNLGAATPVEIGGSDEGAAPEAKKSSKAKDNPTTAPTNRGTLRAKQINDAAAYIRGLAQLRGRNGDWAERAVREAVSLSAEDALRLKVIDVVAPDVPDLLRQLDGRKVPISGGERLLQTAGAEIVEVKADWRARLLMAVTDPGVAVILLMLGIYGLIFEFMNPGFVAPGVLGGICLLVALYALQLLPINYAGIALILLGIAFVTAEAFIPSFGALGIGGIAALAIGMLILVDPETAPGLAIPASFIAVSTATVALAVFCTAWLAVKARRQPVVTGREQLQGAEGEVLEDLVDEGWALVHGERWQVKSREPLRKGERIRVLTVSGLTLTVGKK